jgi:mRNA-degrading endonuclease RelE of RelBE toxin-antitoxin system
MNWRAELSREAQEQLSQFPREVQERLERAVDEFEQRDESQWSNVKALQGPEWKGRFRKRIGPYRIIFRKYHDRARVEISAILIKSKDTYR